MSNTETTERNLGIVKWFGKGGYGFITNFQTKEDVFVHHSGITTLIDCWKVLNLGEYVWYSLESTPDGKYSHQAVNVTGVEGGPLLCETQHLAKQEREAYNTKNGRSRRSRKSTTESTNESTTQTSNE